MTAKITVYAADSNVKGIIDSLDSVNLSQSTYAYTGKACKPEVTVTVGADILKAGKDYTVKYNNNTNVGTAFVTITGKGKYVGSVVKEFTITLAEGGFELKKPIKDVVYNGRLQRPKVSVKSGSRTLKLNRDNTVTYSNNLHATDRAKVTIRGKGNYAGMPSKVFLFRITPCHINKVSVKGKQGGLTLTYAKHKLVEGIDYDITDGTPIRNKIPVMIQAREDSRFKGTVAKKWEDKVL